jgi:hypothetical protein
MLTTCYRVVFCHWPTLRKIPKRFAMAGKTIETPMLKQIQRLHIQGVPLLRISTAVGASHTHIGAMSPFWVVSIAVFSMNKVITEGLIEGITEGVKESMIQIVSLILKKASRLLCKVPPPSHPLGPPTGYPPRLKVNRSGKRPKTLILQAVHSGK